MIVVSRHAVLAISFILAVTWPLTARATNPAPGNACLAGEANTTSPFGGGTSVLDYTSCLSNVWTLEPVQVGAATSSCASGTAGQIQWTGSALQYCNGSSWSTVGTSSTAGSNGYVQFNSSGSFGADSNLLWDNTNKRLGIGTSTPNSRLVVGAGGSGNNNEILTIDSGTGSGGYDQLKMSRNGTEKASLVVAGQAGQGYTNSVANDLTIRNSQNIYLSADGGTTAHLTVTNAGNVGIATNSPAGLFDVNGKLTVLSGGNTGIGTSTPNSRLVVGAGGSGTNNEILTIDSGTGSGGYDQLKMSRNGTEKASLVVAGQAGQGYTNSVANDLTIRNSQNIYLSADGGTTAHLTVTNAGNVGIGTTSPAQALEVNGEIQVDTLASASGTHLCINGSVISSCSSSIRYKENVRDLDMGLNELVRMRPVSFKWKGRDENDLGLIAEEVHDINPVLNTYRDGKIEGVKYSQLTALIINAVKEQQKEIKSLEDKLGGKAANQTLNANSFARLSVNSSTPVKCESTNQGAIALTHLARICACNGKSWIFADGTGASCSW